MRVSANAIAVNDSGEVLLILRDDLRMWSVPGGMLDPNEPPTAAVVREVREETGLEVKPLRLLGLQYWPLNQTATLEFNYICQVQAGEMRPSPESPQVGFFAPTALPRPMLSARRKLINTALSPAASPTWQAHRLAWGTQLGWWWLLHIVYPFKNLRRKWQGNPYIPPPSWQVEVCFILRDEDGRILWLKPNKSEPWQLPSYAGSGSEAPWETALQVIGRMLGLQLELQELHCPSIHQTGNSLTLTFTAQAIGQNKRIGDGIGSQVDYFRPGQEPKQARAEHLDYVASGNVLLRQG